MCNKLRTLLSTMKESEKPMTKSEVLSILKVCGEDMEEQCKKISTLEKKVDNLQITQNLILGTQNSISSMVENINKKLNDDKIEVKESKPDSFAETTGVSQTNMMYASLKRKLDYEK